MQATAARQKKTVSVTLEPMLVQQAKDAGINLSVYRNPGNSQAYPYLLDIQSDIIGELNTRLVIPLHRLKKGASAPVARLTPVIQVEGNDVILMTHEMASVRVKQLGQAVMDASPFRHTIKSAVDFLLDGF